ncbi:uncharacterized protein LOC143163065 isoform X2 [Aptenodytes patagonicus]|uniref:uncharacterized protein LOC143163065 isoform X2 n=1 Tax=Aptenodytes patagonicus TaxID=9234 RepID=UPI003F9F15D8
MLYPGWQRLTVPPSRRRCRLCRGGKREACTWKASAASKDTKAVCRWCSAPLRVPRVQDFGPDAPRRQRIPSGGPRGPWCSPGMSWTALDAELGAAEGARCWPSVSRAAAEPENSPEMTSALPFGEGTGQRQAASAAASPGRT